MEKTNKKDKKILEILTDNARSSISEIARKTGIPRDSVHYRIQRMIKSGVIRQFHTFVNHNKIGYPIYMYVSIELHNFNEEEENKFYSYLNQNPNVAHIAKLSGKFDALLGVIARDLEEFDNIIKDIRRNFSHIIKDYNTASIIKEYKYDRFVDLL